jgi:hypothetical protein
VADQRDEAGRADGGDPASNGTTAEDGGDGAAEGRVEAADGVAARLTPYELAFLEGDFESRVFPLIQDEAEARREDPARLDRFVYLAAGGEAIRDIIPPEAPPEMLEEYRALFYHAFNFWRFGRRLYVLEPPVARYLVEAAPRLEEWEFSAPYDSLYIQLPPNLFWASINTGVPPEPVDGFFVTVARDTDPLGVPFMDVQVVMVLGIHRLRAGFSVIAFDTEAGQGIPPVWTEAGRETGTDFENVLPGGDIAGLYSILTTSEALKLVARVLWYVENHAEDVTGAPAAERRGWDRPGSVPLSRLEFHRVRLGASG